MSVAVAVAVAASYPSLYFLGVSLLGHTPAVQYTLACMVGGSKEGL